MHKEYDYDQLNELCDQIDLLEYAERSYDFQKRGSKYFCSCPKHSDSDPSLCISPDVNLFFCFSCHRKGNIINWMMEYEDLSFQDAVKKVIEITGADIEPHIISQSIKFYKELNKLNSKKSDSVNDSRTFLDIDKDYREKFIDEAPHEWLEEGISAQAMRKYEIRIDPMNNRIVYPVYSDDDKLISVKGRTRFRDYKTLKIAKYMNYYKLGGKLDYFQGMQQARSFIQSSGTIIIFEGLKSVMKVDQWGFHNAVSAETSTLNEYQIELLLKMRVKNVVIAFDKDVDMHKIRECTELLKKFTNVWVVYDKWKLLDDKDSPPDKGRDVWETLYERRIKL